MSAYFSMYTEELRTASKSLNDKAFRTYTFLVSRRYGKTGCSSASYEWLSNMTGYSITSVMQHIRMAEKAGLLFDEGVVVTSKGKDRRFIFPIIGCNYSLKNLQYQVYAVAGIKDYKFDSGDASL